MKYNKVALAVQQFNVTHIRAYVKRISRDLMVKYIIEL